MKKSNIILGGTAFVLAIAGAFASKASNKYNLNACWSKHTTCTTNLGNVACSTGATGVTCKSSTHTCYSTNTCTNKLHTNTQ
ncbi:DUF6520 family protein [Puia dinghuensis]|uniref:DUF6520 family protein n=1 Tax=Puia dinghuensis TaxID=1792502 RepID=UPI003570B689